MITILVCWYALAWAGIAQMAIHDGRILLKEIIAAFILAPLFIFIIVFIFLDEHGDRVIWRANK